MHWSLAVAAVTLSSAATQNASPEIPGFAAGSIAEQAARESRFLRVPAPDTARLHLMRLTQEPHVAGTPEDRAVVEYLRRALEDYGIPAEVTEYHVYLPYPRDVRVTLLEPDSQSLPTREAGIPGDEDSYSTTAMPGWNAYSPNGTVEAQVVYANYGLPEDYEKLRTLGVDVRGKIVLVRYGRAFRAVKVIVAHENGAAGVLLYSDPADDGYVRGDVYPAGPWRPPSAIQRGSVKFGSIYSGDALTPGWAATAGARRIKPEEAAVLPKIPVAPLGYSAAAPILQALTGPNVPESGWQGGLPLPYHVGPGPARVRLHVDLEYAVRPIWNVIGRIRGTARPERWVILGNHHDAWTYGAVDPNSGTIAMLEAARGLGTLVREGWQPQRTILLAFWDGEEYGLLGSTEWVEQHRAELQEKAVAYINLDSFVRGDLDLEGVPALTPLLRSVADAVADPRTGRPLGELWLESQRSAWRARNRGVPEEERPTFHVEMGALGSGSDYTAFLDHAGIPSVDVDMSGPYGVYHALYDDFRWFADYGDPGFLYSAAFGRILGLLALRLADADVVPLRYSETGRKILDYLDELEKGNLDDDGRPRLDLDLSEARRLAAAIRDTAASLEARLRGALQGAAPAAERRAAVNGALLAVERAFLAKDGLARRPWYKHTIYAPGLYAGYASLPLPGPAQAILDRNATELDAELAKLNGAMEAVLRALERAHRAF